MIPFRWLSRPPRIALVMGVMNEERFLHAHLAYHRCIGVERTYLFLDQSTDQTANIASRFPGVRTLRLKGPYSFEYIADFHRLAMDQAMIWAQEEGIDWLMILDPDEFAHGGSLPESATTLPGKLFKEADLRPLLAALDESVLQVRLSTREVLPCWDQASLPFHHQAIFQKEIPVSRTIFDPLNKIHFPWNDYAGHRQGKCLVRTSARVQAFDSHRWTSEQFASLPARPEFVPIPTVEQGWHAHYFITSSEHWLNKYRQLSHEPDRWICGTPVEPPIQVWKNVCAAWAGSPELPHYIKNHVFLSGEVTGALLASGRVVRESRLQRMIDQALQLHPLCDHPIHPIEEFSPQEIQRRPARAPNDCTHDFSPTRLPPDLLEGFHAVELYKNRPFRWSAPSSRILVDLPPGRYDIQGEVGHWVRPDHAHSLKIRRQDHELTLTWAPASIGKFTALLSIPESSSSPFWLELESFPRRPSPQDSRSLSLPWIEFLLRKSVQAA